MIARELNTFLDDRAYKYETPEFIEHDPIQVPHQFTKKHDIEIAGFFVAILAWGTRKSIITSANRLMKLFEYSPYDFILNHQIDDTKNLKHFKHRTFQPIDLQYFITSLRHIYKEKGGLENVFALVESEESMYKAIHRFKRTFFELNHPQRTLKHIADPLSGSAAKRINLFLRWMVRSNQRGVDFGMWESIPSKFLSCPLDIHTFTVAKQLGLISSKSVGFKALFELDNCLRQLDPEDPTKYDFALFGLGLYEDIFKSS